MKEEVRSPTSRESSNNMAHHLATAYLSQMNEHQTLSPNHGCLRVQLEASQYGQRTFQNRPIESSWKGNPNEPLYDDNYYGNAQGESGYQDQAYSNFDNLEQSSMNDCDQEPV